MLPAATWYEKDDLNSTDMHTYINPMQMAVAPAWESKSDWLIFKDRSPSVTELSARHFPKPVEDVVMLPLQHDTPDELAQPDTRDWYKGEIEAIPGKTMPKFRVVERDYTRSTRRWSHSDGYREERRRGPRPEDPRSGLLCRACKSPAA